MQLVLAFACFFRLLFTGRLPARAARYLPGASAALPAPTPPPLSALATTTPMRPSALAERKSPPLAEHKIDPSIQQREGALALLGLLQREGRLIDFLRESIDGHADADIGAAARDIHRGCKKVIDDHFVLEAVMPGAEDAAVRVPLGFDPGEVRLIGEVKGAPPYSGILRHHGWRVTEIKLPALSEGVDRRVVAPAEVEV